jgi:hypothetical protein
MNKTKQGVRDLGGNNRRPPVVQGPPPNCEHQMVDHCARLGKRHCGHQECVKCGMGFDVAAGK